MTNLTIAQAQTRMEEIDALRFQLSMKDRWSFQDKKEDYELSTEWSNLNRLVNPLPVNKGEYIPLW